MKTINLDREYTPTVGKTYTLFSDSLSTEFFYKEIKSLTDELLGIAHSEQILLNIIREMSLHKRKLEKLRINPDGSFESMIIEKLHNTLSRYTHKVSEHLAKLPLTKKIWDGRLNTSELQYHLYMIEFELTNRINKENFLKSEDKYAFLPHCLHDLNKDCKAESDGFDNVCRHCSKNCFINDVSKILAEQNIKPYIWMSANIKSLIKKSKSNKQSIGILGIACIPELINGMRRCSKANVPVIGIPLDANRCARWFGEFYPNSVNLKILSNLISIN